jgi:hypothetical protein
MPFLLIVLLLIAPAIQAQYPTAVIDFNTKDIILPTNKELKSAEYVHVKIINLPMDRYKVTINKKDSFVTINQVPALFGALNFGDGYTKLLANLSDYAVKISGNVLPSKDSSSDAVGVDLTSTGNEIFLLNDAKNLENYAFSTRTPAIPLSIRTVMLKLQNIENSAGSAAVKKKKLLDYIFETDERMKFFMKNAQTLLALDDFYGEASVLKQILNTMDGYLEIIYDSVKVKRHGEVLLKRMEIMRKNMFDHYFQYRDQVIIPADDLLKDFKLKRVADCQTFLSRANLIIESKNALIKNLEGEYVSYFDEVLPFYDQVIKSIPLGKSDSMIQRYRKEFYVIADKFDSTFSSTMIASACDFLNFPVGNEFVSLPYALRGDITEFEVKLDGPQPYSTILYMPNKKNSSWSFSTGVYVSGLKAKENSWAYKANLQQQPGTTPPIYDTLDYTLIKESGSKIEAGISALLHVGAFIRNSDFGYHFAFGPGLSMDSKPRPRVMIGAGGMFGRKNQLMFTVGWLGGAVRNLSDVYEADKNYPNPSTDIMKDRFRGSWFFSLTYAFL